MAPNKWRLFPYWNWHSWLGLFFSALWRAYSSATALDRCLFSGLGKFVADPWLGGDLDLDDDDFSLSIGSVYCSSACSVLCLSKQPQFFGCAAAFKVQVRYDFPCLSRTEIRQLYFLYNQDIFLTDAFYSMDLWRFFLLRCLLFCFSTSVFSLLSDDFIFMVQPRLFFVR